MIDIFFSLNHSEFILDEVMPPKMPPYIHVQQQMIV